MCLKMHRAAIHGNNNCTLKLNLITRKNTRNMLGKVNPKKFVKLKVMVHKNHFITVCISKSVKKS